MGENVITIRRLRSGEVDLFKQMRLISLQDAPYAFSSSYDSALQRSAESWYRQAESTVQGSDRATFIAVTDDQPIGIAALYRLEDQADTGELLRVWVNPRYRGTNVAVDLMNSLMEWAGENNFRRIIAGVTKENARALKFYVRYGFVVQNEDASHDSDGVDLEIEID